MNSFSEKTTKQLEEESAKIMQYWKDFYGENKPKTPPLTQEEQKIFDEYAAAYGGRSRRSRKHRGTYKRKTHRRKSRGGRRHKKSHRRHRR
jgi:hypothetical protein